MDRNDVKYYLQEIHKKKGTPFGMNEVLAQEFFPYVKAAYPEAIMVKYGFSQYIIVTKRAKNVLMKHFLELRRIYEEEILEIDQSIEALQKNNKK